MPIQKMYVGVEGDRCRCGRKESIRHCPNCGSFQVDARPSLRKSASDCFSAVKPVEFFRCRRCGLVFEDALRKDCEAPIYETEVMKAVRVVLDARHEQLVGNPLTRSEQRAVDAIEDLGVKSVVDEIIAQQDPELVRRLSLEYVADCIRNHEHASPQAKNAYIMKRLEERQRNATAENAVSATS